MSVCVCAVCAHPHLQMKIINPCSLIFMALTNDSAAVIYWNNPATQIEQATFQPCAHAAATLNVYSQSPALGSSSVCALEGKLDQSKSFLTSLPFHICFVGEHSINVAKQANKLSSIVYILIWGRVKV